MPNDANALNSPSLLSTGAEKLTILVVDPERYSRMVLTMALSSEYDVEEAISGPEVLACFETKKPDLILIEGDLPELDGYETCRLIRQQSDVPVIFVTNDSSADFMLAAFECGANDFIAKPFDIRVFIKKVNAVVASVLERRALLSGQSDQMALSQLMFSTIGDSGVLLNFMREVLKCSDFASIVACIVNTLKSLGLNCCVRMRYNFLTITQTTLGDASPIEMSVIDHVSKMGRLFQFKSRLAVNYENITIVVFNLPDNSDQCGRLRDNIAVLCESAQALAENLMRQFDALNEKQSVLNNSVKARAYIASLKELQGEFLTQAQMLLHSFVNNVELEYRTMDLLLDQEQRITAITERNAGKVFDALHENGIEFAKKSDEIIDILLSQPGKVQSVEMF